VRRERGIEKEGEEGEEGEVEGRWLVIWNGKEKKER
jgi:hypothetical protein